MSLFLAAPVMCLWEQMKYSLCPDLPLYFITYIKFERPLSILFIYRDVPDQLLMFEL